MTMGEVIELGSEVTNLAVGDRVVVPFTISCGQCWYCEQGSILAVTEPIPMLRWRARPWDSRLPACSALAICWEATRAARPNTSAYPWLTSGRLRSPDNVTDEQALFPTRIPHRLHGRREMRKSKMAIRLRFGAVGRSGSLQSGRLC